MHNYDYDLAVISDVKFHEFFWREIYREIFLKYFKNFTMFFRACSTHTRLIFFICQTLPFVHLCILQLPIVQAPGHTTLFFDIYNVFVVSCQLMCAESNSDVCQLVSVEHFFLWHEIQDGRQKM